MTPEKTLTLVEIKAEVERLAKIIQAGSNLLPTFGISIGEAWPCIRVEEGRYYYTAEERGIEVEGWVPYSLSELLEKTFIAVTFEMAMDYAAKHQKRGEDSRRHIFPHQVYLLSQLSPEWAKNEADRQQNLLWQFPYRDHFELFK